ncbi:hypothetical protein, partial [Oleiphilus sp. HI0123]
AVPTQLILARSEGVMVLGAFGNPAACETTNSNIINVDRVWVPRSHAEYETIYSTLLAAMMASKKVNFYIHSCTTVPWFGGDMAEYNQMTVGDVRIFKD